MSKYFNNLDPDEIRRMEEEQRDDEYWKTVAELEKEDKAMERYYERKHNQ